ncbi:hypothetical protein BSQ39_06580 [Loigolactobacillus backii]|uniref:Nucleoid-associated protein n=1 Tax=Loigolactobacillus backii TaxID=375175 RepID=A0A192H3D1_9LACO|nr:nucleoid-associated protein [Loigolactobacillus backii]ANK59329.1 hypothetical protein AYR52_03150 [Loigolactobacillus backii]ANK62742.1 hypothetical protein AYR53_08265 [Loigolactobacillus backii]ANK64321.1 hypothetical protein AYR54_03150 [Loigolactobacillus backii]ANK67284.1 hypothetical protein AYR55_05890 [Loigolactobacillus backii]ANK70250.1 hypothetical protein AYR56_08740 [Loigolactobacillus backii]
MQINHAVLHITDQETGTIYYSQRELDLNDPGVAKYIEQVTKRFLKRDVQTGLFPDDNPVAALLLNDADFLTKSQQLTQELYDFIAPQAEIPRADFLVVDVTEAEQDYCGLFKLNHGQNFVHFLNYDEQEVANQIILNQSVLPSSSHKIDDGFLMTKAQRRYYVASKVFAIDGEKQAYFSKIYLGLTTQPTLTESVKTVGETAKTVAAEFTQDDFETSSQTKQAIFDSLSDTSTLDVDYVADQVFKDNEPAKKAFTEKVAQKAVPAKKEDLTRNFDRKLSKQRLKLDNGIELIIPMAIYQDKEQIEFVNNPDGTISVMLKNIGDIQNKF